MRIGLLFDLQLPRPWGAEDERRALEHTLAQVRLADELGFASAWVQEHHFLEELGHGGGAVAILGALAAQTTAIRLGLSVLSVDRTVRHPAVLAAEIATLDLLAGRRLDVATGVALAGVEVAGLGLQRQSARAVWEHETTILARMLDEYPFAGAPANATEAALPARTVVPRPAQRPHPPLWARCDRAQDVGTAARHGLGALCRAPLEPDEADEWAAEYRTILASASCVPVGADVEARVAVCLPMSVHADEAVALEQGLDAAHFRAFATAHYERFGEHRPGTTDLAEAFARQREDVGLSRDVVRADGAPLAVRVLADGRASLRGAIGTPDQVSELVGRYAAAGVDDLVLLVPPGRGDEVGEHERTCASLRLFAERVLPQVAADDPRTVLEDAIDAALRRRPRVSGGPGAIGVIGASDEPAPSAVARSPGPPSVSGAPRPSASASASASRRPTGAAAAVRRLQRRATERAARSVRDVVGRLDDQRVEQVAGDRALGAVFAGMRSRYVPAAAEGFVGAITYELRDTAGRTRAWTLQITPTGAQVVPGTVPEAALTILLGVADFVRLATGELDPGHLLLSGRMDLRGDVAVAMRLGPMFGR